MHRVTLIPGEGIGPEVAGAACRIVEAAGVNIEWERVEALPVQERRGDSYLHTEWVESIRRNRVALKGSITTPIAEGPPSLNVALRKAHDLGGTASTTEFAHAVLRALEARAVPRPIPAASR